VSQTASTAYVDEPPATSPGPLSGVRVLDAGTMFAGPLCATLLADFGADVIKIEHPVRGDPVRDLGWTANGVPLWWKMVGRNKRSVTLDLSAQRGQALFRGLTRWADVVVENYRPGTFERWSLGWDRLSAENPQLVLLRLSGFGQTGPYRLRPGFGTLAEALSGYAALAGTSETGPLLPPFALADGLAAYAGALSVMMALYHREARGGRGQVIDMSLIEPIFWLLGPQASMFDQLGLVQERTGNRSLLSPLRNTYRTADDRWVALAASTGSTAKRVLRVVGGDGLASDARFIDGAARMENADALDTLVRDWISGRSLADVLDELNRAEAPVAPIYDIADIVADEHFQERELFQRVVDPDLGSVLMQGLIAKFSETPGSIRFTGPHLGQHTEEVLQDVLGCPEDERRRLKADGVV
jgi:crotonobetainyl-CoA:carnitine CoA-transferase CaiB-like acyl-CoA transferase